MKHKTIFLLLLMLTATRWLAAQHAVWWDSSPPPGNTTRDHSISYGNGFAWQVALGTAQSEDVAHDAIAVSSGGYLVVGANYFSSLSKLVIYRLSEEGDLIWEKGYSISDYTGFFEFSVIEKPDGGFLLTGYIDYGTNPRAGILIITDMDGDTLSTYTFSYPNGILNDVRLIKSDYDEAFFLSYRHSLSGLFNTKIYKLSYELDTLAYTEIHNFPFPEYVPKPFGYIYRGGHFESVFYHYLINFQGEVLDSFPDPFGTLANGTNPMQSLRNGSNFFSRLVLQTPRVFRMATTKNSGEVLHINPACYSANDIWWLKTAGRVMPQEFSDGSICTPFNFYFDWNDNESIGLVKINSLGEHLGDTAINRAAGSMMLTKVLEGGDGRPVIFGTGENGPLGGPTIGRDIFIAKLESWNPVSAPTIEATGILPLKVYPNPVEQTVTVELPQGAKGTLTVTSVNGIKIQSQKVNGGQPLTLNTSHWPKGQLVVSLHTTNGVYSTKLIKNF